MERSFQYKQLVNSVYVKTTTEYLINVSGPDAKHAEQVQQATADIVASDPQFVIDKIEIKEELQA